MTTKRQDGFSLIELLIVVGLSSVLLMGVWRVYYVFHRMHARLHQQMTEAIELQLIESLLRNSIRSAGYTPCMSLDHLINKEGLHAYQLSRESISLSRMDNPIYAVSSLDDQNLMLTQPVNLNPNKSYLIADCYHAELVKVRATYKQHVMLMQPLHYHYEQPVYFGLWLSERFFMRHQPKPALMVQHLHTETLSDEVTAFQVEEEISVAGRLLKIKLQTALFPAYQVEVRVRAS